MDWKSVYFIGAGGIGMSALVRYFLSRGFTVAGYDRTETQLTKELEAEGALIHYEDNPDLIPISCRDRDTTVVVFTPAISADHKERSWFAEKGFTMRKRAEVLGDLTRSMKGLCAAGTHGKTTTSAMAAHLLHESHVGCNAFLGGITKNYGTNYLLSESSPYVVIEADEFDRSFHHLRPWATAITSTDADHLDIYGTEEAYLDSFRHYSSLVQPGGALILHTGLKMKPAPQEGVSVYTYSRTSGDFHADNVRIGCGHIVFDYHSPLGDIKDVELGVPVSINIENGIAAMALAQFAGAEANEIRRAMASFGGVDRRFDFKIKTDRHVLLSDYAHHPQEIAASIRSLREVFTGRRITGIFQPHLYTRTRDFYADFAESLSLLDEVVLTEIYPAREQPIEGVTSQLIYDRIVPEVTKHLISKSDLPAWVKAEDTDVLVVLGAGDVEDYMQCFAEIINAKNT